MSSPPVRPETDWLLTSFTDEVAEVAHAIALSADGLLLARSRDLPRERGEQLAAIACGLTSLTQGAAGLLEAGAVLQNVVEMDHGFLFLMSMGRAGALATLAGRGADVGRGRLRDGAAGRPGRRGPRTRSPGTSGGTAVTTAA